MRIVGDDSGDISSESATKYYFKFLFNDWTKDRLRKSKKYLAFEIAIYANEDIFVNHFFVSLVS